MALVGLLITRDDEAVFGTWFTYFRHHWIGLEHRTGVRFPVSRFEDLFVERVPRYQVCDRFDGVFDQPWSIGEEFRPSLRSGTS